MIIRFFYEGGASFMFWIYLMWIIVFIQAIRFIILYRTNKAPHKLKRINDSVLFVGSLGFLTGTLAQMVGVIDMFDSIQRIGNVAPALIAGGLKVSMIAPVFGLSILLLSAIIWFIFRNLLLSDKK